jgi:predicted phage terminase large subunit-like protein
MSVVQGHGPADSPRIGALQGGNVWWVCPTYNISNQIWRDLKKALIGAWVEKSEVERRIVLPGGGSITVRSTDNPDSLRGSGLDGLVIDEAAYVKEDAWAEALRPALSDREGWCIFISTPQGRNWFWKLFERVPKLGDWARWQRPTADNPKIPQTEIEAAKLELGPYKFAQEYEAQFIAPGAHQFKPEWFKYFTVDPSTGFYQLLQSNGDLKTVAPQDLFRFATTDLATSLKETADYSVVSVFGVTPEADLLVLDVQRSRMAGPDHINLLNRVYQKWHPGYIGIEKTGFQLSVVQTALREGLPVRPIPADKDKVSRASSILARFAAGTVYARDSAPWLPDWEEELLNFPNGDHDDQVDTMSMAGIMLAERPGRRMLFPEGRKIDEAFVLQSQLNPEGAIRDYSSSILATDKWDPDADSDTETTEETAAERSEWLVADGSSLDTLLAALKPEFQGDAQILWHAHLSVAAGGGIASVALGRISNWKRVVTFIENAPMEVEVPLFEVPLVMRVIAPRVGHLNLGACADFIIALRQVRRFLITSASVAGFQSASLVQKFVRAGLVTVGALIDPNTGVPYGTGAPMAVDKQPYTDLQLAVNEGRIRVMNYGWASRELMQLEDGGQSITGLKETSDSVAGVVGYLSRFGHSVLTMPGEDYVTLDDLGIETYEGVRY